MRHGSVGIRQFSVAKVDARNTGNIASRVVLLPLAVGTTVFYLN
jgi:hypothetical protein